MDLRARLARIVAPLLLTGLVAGLAPACGGKTFGGEGPGEDSGVEPSDSGTGIGFTADGGAACVEVEVASSDLSCKSDQDCTLIRSGNVCNGECSCGDTPVNAAASARVDSETASLTLEACPCAFPGEPRCLAGQCTLCAPGPNGSADCADSGTTTTEDSGVVSVDAGEIDAGVSTGDGGTCVDIDLSAYDSSCNQTSDCILIRTGEVCSGQCECGGEPVNASEETRYRQATSGITFGLCFCPIQASPECLENRCVFPVAVPSP
jgi:hypothetical protein